MKILASGMVEGGSGARGPSHADGVGEHHPATLRSMDNPALMYLDQGQLKEAEKLQVRRGG